MKDLVLYENEKRNKSNYTVHIQDFKKTKRFRPHWHDHYELLFFREGDATVYCNDTRIEVAPGDLVVVNRAEIHTMESVNGADYYCLFIHDEFFTDIDAKNIQFPNHIQRDATTKLLMRNIYDEHHLKQPGSDMMLKCHAYALMTHLLRNYTIAHLSHKETSSIAKKSRRIEKVVNFIEKNYNDKISTQELAELCHLNESYFCRAFKKATGRSVLDYLNNHRIEKSIELLKQTEDSIGSIALQVGFDDMTYFGRVFKSIKGVSPSQFRKYTTN